MTLAFPVSGPWLAYGEAVARYLLLNWVMQASCWLAAGLLASRMPRLGAAARHAVLLVSLVAAALAPVAVALSDRFQPTPQPTRMVASRPSINKSRLSPLRGTAASPAGNGVAHAWTDHLGSGLAAVWALLVLIRLSRLGAGYWLVSRWGRHAVPVDRSRLYDACRYHVADIPVVEAAGVPVPTVSGVLAPRILLPRGMAERLSAEELGLVLLHEEAHVRRRDPLWLLVAEGAHAVIGWHPLAGWCRRSITRAAEDACDAHVLGQGARETEYARTLLTVLENVPPVRAAVSCPLGSAGAELRRRVAIILQGSQSVSPLMAGMALWTVALSGAAATQAQVGERPLPPRRAASARRAPAPVIAVRAKPRVRLAARPLLLTGRPVDALVAASSGTLPAAEAMSPAEPILAELKTSAPQEGHTLVFLLDNSSSMRPFQQEARTDILAHLEQLAAGDRFNVVVFADDVKQYAAAPVAPDAEALAGIRAWLGGLPEASGSNLGAGMLKALATPDLTSLWIYSDGKPTGSVTDSRSLGELLARENRSHAQVLSVAFGSPAEERLEFAPGAAPAAPFAPAIEAGQRVGDELLP